MRIWSIHPQYLDARGLVALWREGLLAQAVLRGETKGYHHHPQLLRFREQASPVARIAAYLWAVHDESVMRGYHFSAEKIDAAQTTSRLTVTRGQLDFEWRHLMEKLGNRDPQRSIRLASVKSPLTHPLLLVAPGEIAPWEKATALTPVRKNEKMR